MMGQVNNLKDWLEEVHSWLDSLESKDRPYIEQLIEDIQDLLIELEKAY